MHELLSRQGDSVENSSE